MNPLDVIYEIVADLSKDSEGNSVLCWIDLDRVVTAANAHDLSVEEVQRCIVCWVELEVMRLNPFTSRVKFVAPFFSP